MMTTQLRSSSWAVLLLVTVCLTLQHCKVAEAKKCGGTLAYRSPTRAASQYILRYYVLQPLAPCGISDDIIITYADECIYLYEEFRCKTWDGTYTATIDDNCPCLRGDAKAVSKEGDYVIYIRGLTG